MNEFSVLIGGKAGSGIDRAGTVIGRLFGRAGYSVYIYREYPSLIRGGHTFSIVRASEEKVAAHRDAVDVVIALNQETADLHATRLRGRSLMIYDAETVKAGAAGVGIPLGAILKEEGAPEIMRNTCMIGAFCRAAGIAWGSLDGVLRGAVAKELELNLKVARRGYDASREIFATETLARQTLPLLTGSETMGLGLIRAGLESYIAYPMTPASGLLHFLAERADEFGLTVMHPESEIAVILMALGASYAGMKTAVGSSGGGFCLMTEGVSFSAMAELPVVVMVGQRPGPSTGLPTYTGQTELDFVMSAGQGEFARFIVAPGDAEEAYYWSAAALAIAWKYQMPSFIMTDKTLAEGVYSFDIDSAGRLAEASYPAWDRKGPYRRYAFAAGGVSPLAFPSDPDAVVKINSYEHDESGISTEDPGLTTRMQAKRIDKLALVRKELAGLTCVVSSGDRKARRAIVSWGSNKGVAAEAARALGARAIHIPVLAPFPTEQLALALKGVERSVVVENNATGQLARLMAANGFAVTDKVLKFDGRPFSVGELEERARLCGI